MQFLRKFYGLLLNLYPKGYREEYSDELETVFNLSLDNAMEWDGFEPARLILREFVSLPKAAVIEHLRERRNAKMIRRFDSYFDFAYGSWKEFLTALLPFFLAGGIMPLLNYLRRAGLTSGTVGTVIVLALFGLFIVLLLVGAKRGMPRWSLPYLGFLLSMLSVYLFSAIFGTPIYLLFRDLRDQSILIIDILWDGIFWYGLLFAIALLVAASKVSPTLQRFRNDWTLLCFILYGAVPFALWLTFDEYVGDEPYTLLAFLVLAVGAWIYLRSTSEWTRFGALFAALALAMLIATVGKAILVPTQDWPITIDRGLAISEAEHTVLTWLWLALIMIVPVEIKLLPRAGAPSQPSLTEG